jgi:hypothetical protein
MTTIYELWDFESGNQIGSYESEAAALDDVRDSLAQYGEQSVESLLLGRECNGQTELVAKGAALLELAGAGGPGRSSDVTTIIERTSIEAADEVA